MLGFVPANRLTVELVGPDGGYYPGTVTDVKPEASSVLLKFENDVMPEGWFPCNGNLYEAPPRRTVEETRERLVIPGPVEVLYRPKQGAAEAWYPGQLVAEDKGIYTIDLAFTPPRRIHQPIEQLRVPRHPVPLHGNSIQRVAFVVPENARGEATDDRHLMMFAQYGKFDSVRYDPETKSIIVMVYGKAGVQRAEILADMYLNHAASRQNFRNEIANMRIELFGPENTGHDDHFRIEFTVPEQYLHRAVGGQHQTNLQKARGIPGITRVWVDLKTSRFHVTATDEATAKLAQEILEFVNDVVYIENIYVGHLIGKGGQTINEIQRNSNVLSLFVHDTPEMLRGSGLPFDWREGFVPVVLTGLRAETDLARMLIEFQVDHNRQMDAERRRSIPERPERHRAYRGNLSRQHTNEHNVDVNGEATTRPSVGPDTHVNDVRRQSDQSQRSRDGEHPIGTHSNFRGGPPRRDAAGPFNGRREQQSLPQRREGAGEEKRTVHGDTKEWPELGQTTGGVRSSPPSEGVNLSTKADPNVKATVMQNGDSNGHSDVRPQTQAGGFRNGDPGTGYNQRGRGRGGYRGGHRNEDHRTERGRDSRTPAVGDHTAASDGQQDGRPGDIDEEGYKAVQPRGKRGPRGQRGAGNSVASGIRQTPGEPTENRREDQVREPPEYVSR